MSIQVRFLLPSQLWWQRYGKRLVFRVQVQLRDCVSVEPNPDIYSIVMTASKCHKQTSFDRVPPGETALDFSSSVIGLASGCRGPCFYKGGF